MLRRFHTLSAVLHENPLGLPRKSGGPTMPRMSKNLPVKRPIPNISKIILVASGKGGVGKSTVSANLALSFQKIGKTCGLLDADIFGPSVPKLFNIQGEPRISDAGKLIPKTNYGLPTMSMGYLIPEESSAIAWRGLMVMKALQQLLYEVEWPRLDFLVIDMPPGTGDVQLTIGQQLVVAGAVIVSTPQDIALLDVKKGITMFNKVDIPILGLVENMSMFACPNCGHESHIFGSSDHILSEAERNGVKVLGSVPLDTNISRFSDSGKPIVIGDSTSRAARVYENMAKKIVSSVMGSN